MIACPHCGATQYQKKQGLVKEGYQRIKCLYCVHTYMQEVTNEEASSPTRYQYNSCLHCGKETTNPKFCSRSCAAAYNNTIMPKRRKRTSICKHCGTQIVGRRVVCDDCIPNKVDWTQRTLGEIQAAAKYQINAVGRDLARQAYKRSGLPRHCQNCGYRKHVEICHIKAVKDFPRDTPMSIVSGIENLVALCPNCHWEFDHGRLHYEDIAPR